jgi:hypothetical protein
MDSNFSLDSWLADTGRESEPYRSRRIETSSYPADDPHAKPKVDRKIEDGVLLESWLVPKFRQVRITEFADY